MGVWYQETTVAIKPIGGIAIEGAAGPHLLVTLVILIGKWS